MKWQYFSVFFPVSLALVAAHVDPPVYEAARGHARVPVLILLSNQPYRRVPREPLRRRVYESRYTEAARSGNGIEDAARDLDAADQQDTQALLDAVHVELDADQDAVESYLRELGASRILRYRVVNILRAEI